jgi:hypothetical protein
MGFGLSDVREMRRRRADVDLVNSDAGVGSMKLLGLGTQSYNCLVRRAGILTIDRLCQEDPRSLLRIRALGPKIVDGRRDGPRALGRREAHYAAQPEHPDLSPGAPAPRACRLRVGIPAKGPRGDTPGYGSPSAHRASIRPRRIAFGRNAAGQTARAGGWGYVFGDEGGGVDIVRQAVRAALRMEENWGPPTSLRQALLDATGQASANRVLHLFYTPDWPRSRAAALASLVDSAAAEGDPVALHILESAAQELALLAAAVRAPLWRPGEFVDVAYIGGVFTSQRLLERYRMLVELEAGNRYAAPLRGPAEGALLEALRSAGIQTRLL